MQPSRPSIWLPEPNRIASGKPGALQSFVDQKLSVPRKMLQRSMSSEASSLDAVNTPGDFYTIPDLELTNVLLDKFLDRPAMRDLLNIVDTLTCP